MSPKPPANKSNLSAAERLFRLQGSLSQLQVAHNALAEKFAKSLQLSGQTAHNVQQLVQAIENTSFAINRLERFTFALIKVLLDQAPLREQQYKALQAAIAQLDGVDDLEVFWDVKEPPTPEELAAKAAEEAAAAQADPFVPPGEAEQDAATGIDMGVEGSDHSVEQVVSVDPDGAVAVVSEQVVGAERAS